MNTNDSKIIQDHEQREKVIFEFLIEAAHETQIVKLKNDDGTDGIPLRIQMIIAFSLLDVLASYWYEYLGETAGVRKKFCAWYEHFCETDKNEEYKGNIQWACLSSSRLYSFRCSLVHFLGMSEKAEGVYISLVPNNLPEKMYKEYQKEFKSSNSIIIKPHSFHSLINEGAKLMLEGWEETIKKSQGNKKIRAEYIRGIEKVYERVMKEGAVPIKL